MRMITNDTPIAEVELKRWAALADQPPPDPRDEALRLAEEVMGSCVGRLDGIPDETGNVVDCVSQLSAALAAIAAAKGEK